MRVRIISVMVQPNIVLDDGENLTPQPVKPLTVLWRDWPEFAARGLQEALQQMQEQIQKQIEPPGE